MNLKTFRIQNKVSQTEMANIIGVSQKTYSNYELSITEPNIETLTKIADYFDVTLDYLVGRPFANEFGYLSDDEKEIIQDYRQMNKENKSKFKSEAKGILIAQK